jgi:hypothetical protein
LVFHTRAMIRRATQPRFSSCSPLRTLRPLRLRLLLSLRLTRFASSAVILGCASLQAATSASQALSDARFWFDAKLPLGRPPAESLLNDNGSPRILNRAHYDRFFREHAAALREWAADPRLRLNPNYVAAIFAKESGFDPHATSHVPANGIAQLTHIADADLQIIARDASAFRWMHAEVRSWPRSPLVHDANVRKARTDSLVASGALSAENEYFFNAHRSTRAAMFWLRILADVWQLDEWPGQHGRLARERLGTAGALRERDLLDLVTVSYNQGHPYAAELLRKHGRDWTKHLNDESRDYLERVVYYTRLFQRSAAR